MTKDTASKIKINFYNIFIDLNKINFHNILMET